MSKLWDWLWAHRNFKGDGCLTWPFAKNPEGYGRVWNGERIVQAHRVMCAYRHGAPPTDKHDAAHLCGKGHLGCVNPQHLAWKTRAENHADKKIHGTSNIGTRNGICKLTEQQAREIKFGKMSQAEAARAYGISKGSVSSIRNGRQWAWLTPS